MSQPEVLVFLRDGGLPDTIEVADDVSPFRDTRRSQPLIEFLAQQRRAE